MIRPALETAVKLGEEYEMLYSNASTPAIAVKVSGRNFSTVARLLGGSRRGSCLGAHTRSGLYGIAPAAPIIQGDELPALPTTPSSEPKCTEP